MHNKTVKKVPNLRHKIVKAFFILTKSEFLKNLHYLSVILCNITECINVVFLCAIFIERRRELSQFNLKKERLNNRA